MTAPAWCLHVGAHKTGTTHLQDVLAAAEEALTANGVRALVRPRRLLEAGYPRPGLLGALGAPVRAARLRAGLAGSSRGASRVVISEENLLGPVEGMLDPAGLYVAPARLRVVLRARPAGALTLCLSIRSLARALPSAFFQALKGAPDAPRRFEAARRAAAQGALRWADLVRRLAALAPGARLVVWRQEDYARDPRPALDRLAGTGGVAWPDLPAPARTRSPAPAALEEVAALPGDLPRAARRAAVLEIYARHPAAPGAPGLLAPDEIAALDALYARDVEEIRALAEVVPAGAGA